MLPNTQLELAQAVEELYSTFSYKLAPSIDGCPCCVNEDDQKRLRSAPLRDLSADDLTRHAHKALSTWGDQDDLRHFLPRLFELAAREHWDGGLDVQILFGKLRYGKWHTWPAREQAAITKYLRALWRATPASDFGVYQVEERLYSVGCATDDIGPFLEMWIEPPCAHALHHLSAWLLSGEALGEGFWEPKPRSRAQAWLLNPNTSQSLEAIFFDGDQAIQALASGVLDGVALLRHVPMRRE